MYYQIFSVSFHSQLQELSLWNHSAGTIGDPSLELHCSNPTSCIQKGLLNLDYTVVLAWRWVSPCQGQEDGTGTGKEKKQTSSRPMSGTEEERGGGGCHHELLQNKIFNKCLFRNILILLSLKLTKNVFHYLCCLPEVELIPYSSSPCREVSERVLGVGCVMFVEWSWRNQETPEKKSLDL